MTNVCKRNFFCCFQMYSTCNYMTKKSIQDKWTVFNFLLEILLNKTHNAGVNRCLKANCSHLCLPTPAHVVCACPTGFAKINETDCEKEIDKFLIFATEKDIRYECSACQYFIEISARIKKLHSFFLIIFQIIVKLFKKVL